jgi:hypothetical protein
LPCSKAVPIRPGFAWVGGGMAGVWLWPEKS